MPSQYTVIVITFGVIVAFIYEKQNKTYKQYVAVSIAEEKVARAQKIFQSNWIVRLTGKVGV